MFFKSKPTYDWLVVGLGNPGIQYENTRHNAGFMAADLFMSENGGSFNKHKFEAVFGECKLNNLRILIMKPQTFMNNSGRAVTALSSFFKIPADRIIVISDDVSLDVGKIRIRRKGSHGGHNGLKDIFQLMGTDEITRVKIGVGEKPQSENGLVDWVLGKFKDEDKDVLNDALKNAASAIKEIMLRGTDSAMNKFNG